MSTFQRKTNKPTNQQQKNTCSAKKLPCRETHTHTHTQTQQQQQTYKQTKTHTPKNKSTNVPDVFNHILFLSITHVNMQIYIYIYLSQHS